MKIKLLIIPDEAEQVILTPETQAEKEMLDIFKKPDIKIYTYCHYEVDKCEAGYFRAYDSDESVCIVVEKEEK